MILANEKLLYSKMLVESSNRAHFPIDLQAGMVTSGYLPDGRQLALRQGPWQNSFAKHMGSQ